MTTLGFQVPTQPLAAETVSLIDKATLVLVSFIPEVNSKMNIERSGFSLFRAGGVSYEVSGKVEIYWRINALHSTFIHKLSERLAFVLRP